LIFTYSDIGLYVSSLASNPWTVYTLGYKKRIITSNGLRLLHQNRSLLNGGLHQVIVYRYHRQQVLLSVNQPSGRKISFCRLDRIAGTVDAFKENVSRAMVSTMPMPLERDQSSFTLPPGPLVRDSTAAAIAVALQSSNAASQKPNRDNQE
jgi:hypothetical protein